VESSKWKVERKKAKDKKSCLEILKAAFLWYKWQYKKSV